MFKSIILACLMTLSLCATPSYAAQLNYAMTGPSDVLTVDKTPSCMTTFEAIDLIMNTPDLKGKVELIQEFSSDEEIDKIKDWVKKETGMPDEMLQFTVVQVFSNTDRVEDLYLVLFEDVKIDGVDTPCMVRYFWQDRDQVHEMVGYPDGSF